MRRLCIPVAALFFACAPVACGGSMQGPAPAQQAPVASQGERTQGRPACDADNGGITLPQGFCALVAHEGVGAARHIAVAPNGDVYVAIRDREGQPGGIVGLRDTDADGRLDQSVRFGPGGGTGIAVQDGFLYFAPNTAVVRYRLPDAAELEPRGPADTVVSGFPEQRSHSSKTLALDGRGSMWVNVGAPSNACQTRDREHGSAGQDPCPQLEQQAGVWRFDANRLGQRQEDGTRWVTGTRNLLALTFNPGSGGLYGVQHGRDMLDVVAPGEFTPQENAGLPAEEFLRLEQGDNFGWPYCYYDPEQKQRALAPEYGGNGQEVGRCTQYKAPLASYPAHWAPQELLFYTGEQFPARYRGGAFIAWHGSWNRAPEPQQGFKMTFQPMANGTPAAEWEVFADGFAGRETVANPREAEHRPMGLALAPDGSLYIVDSMKGRIWRVLHPGNPQ